MNVDFHLHTGNYDGEGTPQEIVQRAIKVTHLDGIVLLDHDMEPPFFLKQNSEGDPANIGEYGSRFNICVKTAVEITVEAYIENVHLLWYNYCFARNAEIQVYFQQANENKQNAYKNMCANLQSNGYNVLYDDILKKTKIPSRLHILNSLVDYNYVTNIHEAKSLLESPRYICPVKRLSIGEGVEFIKKFDGIVILAHPLLIPQTERTRLIEEAIEAGLDGFEFFYPYAENSNIYKSNLHALIEMHSLYNQITKKNNKQFLLTGGSDYHGNKKPGVSIGSAYIDTDISLFFPE